MKVSFKYLAVFLSIVMILSLVTACSNQTAKQPTNNNSSSTSQANQEKPKEESATKGQVITILTGGTSGVYFPLGNMLAKIYTDKLGAQASAQTTGASAENASKISQKIAEVGFAMGDTIADAYNGTGKYKDTGGLKNLRAIASLYPNYMQIVATKKSGIKTLQDLKGKHVAVGAPGSGTEIMANRVLKAVGLTYDDINEDFLSFSEGVDGMKNGTIDAVVFSSGIPNAGIMELTTTEEVVILPIEQSVVTEIQKEFPAFASDIIPKNTYKGVDIDVPTAIVNNILITHADLSEQFVYELTKALFENLGDLQATHNAAKSISIEKATKGLPLPLHPGAEKYYKEKGVLK